MANVTIDGSTKLITVNALVTDIDIQVDVYSEWKNWTLLSDNLKWVQAMRSTGGDPLPGGEFLGSTYFMVNGWKIEVNDSVTFTGNIFSDDGSSPFQAGVGVVIATSQISTLVERVTTAQQNAAVFV